MEGEYGGKLGWLSWILWGAFVTANICQFVRHKDKGYPKEWWKVEQKEKEKKMKYPNKTESIRIYMIHQTKVEYPNKQKFLERENQPLKLKSKAYISRGRDEGGRRGMYFFASFSLWFLSLGFEAHQEIPLKQET